VKQKNFSGYITAELAMDLFYASLVLFYIAAMAFTASWWQPMDPRDFAKPDSGEVTLRA
jgi:hypothetical protein